MIRLPRPALAIFAGLVVVFASACGSSAATPGAGGTSGPGGGPSGPAGTSSVAPSASSGVPGTQLPIPSFAGDPELAAKFPKQVDGQPVTNVTTVRFIDVRSAFDTTPSAAASTKAELDSLRTIFAGIGLNLDTMVFGSATATVSGSSVGIVALRVPGQDANKLIQNYAMIPSALSSGDTMSQATVGGKNVTLVKSATGTASNWMYANGDMLWEVSTSNQDEAAAVFTALP